MVVLRGAWQIWRELEAPYEAARVRLLVGKTVDRHVSNIYTKLRVSSRAGVTAHAYQHRLLEPPPRRTPHVLLTLDWGVSPTPPGCRPVASSRDMVLRRHR